MPTKREAPVDSGLQTVRIFLASSAELKDHRDAFDLQVRQLDDRWLARGIRFQPVRWENFIDAMSPTGLQDAYNRAITDCDIFVMLFRRKVGAYTAEEFEKAFGQFKDTGRPLIYTYFHNDAVQLGAVVRAEMQSLWAFQDKLQALGHYKTDYENVEALLLHFVSQLEKLHADGHLGRRGELVPPPQTEDPHPLPSAPRRALVPRRGRSPRPPIRQPHPDDRPRARVRWAAP
jgi:hypothetical protein